MGKAFQCDNCGDLFTGDAHHLLENGAEICSECYRSIKALSTIDSIKYTKIVFDKNKKVDWTPRENWPLHTGEHSQ